MSIPYEVALQYANNQGSSAARTLAKFPPRQGVVLAKMGRSVIPVCRNLQVSLFSSRCILMVPERPAKVEAVLAQVVGTDSTPACKSCEGNYGPFISCRVVDGFLKGSCANCHFNGKGPRCNFRCKFSTPSLSCDLTVPSHRGHSPRRQEASPILCPPLRHPSRLLRSLQCLFHLHPRLLRSLWSLLSPLHTTASFVSSGSSAGASALESTISKLSLMRSRYMCFLIRFQTGRASSPVSPRIWLAKNGTLRLDKWAASQEYREGHSPSESTRSCVPLFFYGHGYFGSNV
jgi:hypothetical protein